MSARAGARRRSTVAFRVAAGPRQGFGHLVRATVLARRLGVTSVVSPRGGAAAARIARSLGCRVVRGRPADVLRASGAGLLVLDDPVTHAARPWRLAAARAGVPVASLHDLGRGHVAADLTVDGSLSRRRGTPRATLCGPAFCILDPRVRRSRRPGRRPQVVIALGGGPRATAGRRLARAIRRRRPDVTVHVAPGFVRPITGEQRRRVDGPMSPARLLDELARATVAITGGGVTLYEACAMGVPVVAVAVVAGQRPTVRAFVRRRLAVAGGEGGTMERRAASAVLRLLDDPRRRRSLSREGRRRFDGLGAVRVAAALRALMRRDRREP